MENLIFRQGVGGGGRIFLQNASYTIQFILTIYINMKNSCCQEDALLLNFSVESAEN